MSGKVSLHMREDKQREGDSGNGGRAFRGDGDARPGSSFIQCWCWMRYVSGKVEEKKEEKH